MFVEIFHECDGVTMIERLQNHHNHSIYERTVRILEEFFGAEEDAESSAIAPEIKTNANQFGFSADPNAANFRF